jgi:hypothetical protein
MAQEQTQQHEDAQAQQHEDAQELRYTSPPSVILENLILPERISWRAAWIVGWFTFDLSLLEVFLSQNMKIFVGEICIAEGRIDTLLDGPVDKKNRAISVDISYLVKKYEDGKVIDVYPGGLMALTHVVISNGGTSEKIPIDVYDPPRPSLLN